MYVIQILRPIYDNEGVQFSAADVTAVRAELTETFGGVTEHGRAPARGHWKEADDATVRDDVVTYEVVADSLDRAWWREYSERLRLLCRLDKLVVAASAAELL